MKALRNIFRRRGGEVLKSAFWLAVQLLKELCQYLVIPFYAGYGAGAVAEALPVFGGPITVSTAAVFPAATPGDLFGLVVASTCVVIYTLRTVRDSG